MQNNNLDGKTEVQGAMVEVQGAKAECKNEFLCSKVTFKTTEKLPKDKVANPSLSLTSGSQDLLNCKDVRIVDTGVTQHSTFSSSGGGGRNQRTCDV